MKYTIYEDPVTHRFAHLPLPGRLSDGDALPPVVMDRWFETRDDAIAALSELLNRDDEDLGPSLEVAAVTYSCTGALLQVDLARRPSVWYVH